MVYEISVSLKIDINVYVHDNDELIPLSDFIVGKVKRPNYIVGDGITATADSVTFSVRYLTETARDEITAFIQSVKPYATAGIIAGHICHHDTKEPCEAVTEIERWGEWEL